MRGRSRNKGPNPLTRSYESNGPDVKIRGTAQHIADKYAQLSRDAQASGDPVAAENYLQHAEHYYRLIAAAQEQYRQQFGGGFQRDEEGDEGDEESGFAVPMGPGQSGEDFSESGGYAGGHGFEQRGDRQGQQPRYDRNDRQPPNRQRFDRNGERYDRNAQNGGGERGYDRGERYDRQQGGGFDRQGGQGGGFDRQGGGERYDRPSNAHQQDRRERYARDDRNGPREDRPPRDERAPREEGPAPEAYPSREARPAREARADRRQPRFEEPAAEDDQGGGLPAFLTTPVRSPISVEEVAQSEGLAPATAPAAQGEAEETGIRPRRRRTRKAAAEPAAEQTADGA